MLPPTPPPPNSTCSLKKHYTVGRWGALVLLWDFFFGAELLIIWVKIIHFFLKDYCKNNWLSTGDSLQNSCDVTWWGWLLKPLLRPELRCYLKFCFDTADILGNTIKNGNEKLLNFNYVNLITWIIAEWAKERVDALGLANREAQWWQHQGREGKSHGCAECWVGWPYVKYCSSLFASGSVDSL